MTTPKTAGAFTPDPGTLFYADSKVFRTRSVGSGDVAVAVRERDRSYSESVLLCVAVDNRVVVAEVVYGSTYGTKRQILLRNDYDFAPLGPGVPTALGLDAHIRTEHRL